MSLIWVDEAPVRNGKKAHVGDFVELASDPGFGVEFMIKFLGGPGPYRVKLIGQWPCGRYVFCFDSGASAPTRDFQLSSPEPEKSDDPIELPSTDCGECPLCGAKLVPPDDGGPAYCPEGCQLC